MLARRCFNSKMEHQRPNAESKNQIRRAKDPCGGEKDTGTLVEKGPKYQDAEVGARVHRLSGKGADLTTALRSASGE